MAVGCLKSHFRSGRPNDFEYDPLFLVSGPKDHCRAAMVAKISAAKYQICPIFASMFSDLPNHPRTQYVRRSQAPKPRVLRRSELPRKAPDVEGSDRFKYFRYPSVIEPKMPPLELHLVPQVPVKKQPKVQRRHVQTMYRETSAQTSPWQPPYFVTGSGNSTPELLELDFLKWGATLPVGVHELELIERARMKRRWLATCEVKTEADLAKRQAIIAALERNEWAYREQEIQDVQDLRLELLVKMLGELHQKATDRNTAKLRAFAERRTLEKNAKLEQLQKRFQREQRKLEMKRAGIQPKYRELNALEEHTTKSSEIYAPILRHGQHPKRWHFIIDERMERFSERFQDVEGFGTLPVNLGSNATQIKDHCLKMKGRRLCMRETKWTAPVLKELHQELQALNKPSRRSCSLVKRIELGPSVCTTPEVEGISEANEEYYQAMVTIQSIIKGRASQMHVYEGLERCRELIQELKYSSGLLQEEHYQLHQYKKNIKKKQRDEQIEAGRASRLQETFERLEGNIAGSLMDFLNKELCRLLEERRAHAICILLERQRYDREAAEAGRRQAELRRRQEHDEVFKQIAKIQQETVDLYLEDILRESMNFASEAEAREYVKALAKKIDDEAYDATRMSSQQSIDPEGDTIAELIHHFVVPEAQKVVVREKIQKRQKEKLRAVHDMVYSDIEAVETPQDPGELGGGTESQNKT